MVEHVLEIKDLTKVFVTDDGEVMAVDAINFRLSGNEFFTMLGPSGCGKTTTLRMIAGLETCTSGSIFFDGQDYTQFSAFQRNIGMVFQSYALFPHMSVFENAAYGLRVRKVPESDIKTRVHDILGLLGLQDLSNRYPADLSGGQQQRVSIARALIYDPGMLLLDEPLANLDAKLRIEMREEIRRIQQELRIMTIYVTHDQEEAMSISDQLAVFNDGRLIQAGSPDGLYSNPTSIFVAEFIGKANLFKGRIVRRGQNTATVVLENGIELTASAVGDSSPEFENLALGADKAIVMMRPGQTGIATPGNGQVSGTVKHIQFLGSFYRYVVDCPHAAGEVIVDTPRAADGVQDGSAAELVINEEDARIFCTEAP